MILLDLEKRKKIHFSDFGIGVIGQITLKIVNWWNNKKIKPGKTNNRKNWKNQQSVLFNLAILITS